MRRTTLGAAAEFYETNPPRGEFVLVLEGAQPCRAVEVPMEQGVALVCALRASGLSLRDAVRQAAQQTGLPKNELYERAIGT